MVAVAQVKVPPQAGELPSWRFQLPDIDRHGRWFLPRLIKAFPHLTQDAAIGWLRSLIGSNDYLFLCRDHGVALAVVTRTHPLEVKARIQEVFVFAEEGHDVSAFYDDLTRWARQQGIDTIQVEELTDVPHDAIRERLGRMFTRTVNFARV